MSGDKITALAIGADPAAAVQGLADLLTRMAAVTPGTTVRFTVERAGKLLVLPVIAGRGGL